MSNIIPKQYEYILDEPPKMIAEAIKLYGTEEKAGFENNKDILAWAKEIGGEESLMYTRDEIAWCGLFLAIVAKRAGKPVVDNYLWVRNWLKWGNPVAKGDERLGDMAIFSRKGGGGHGALIVAEDKTCWHVIGGNQANMVNIVRIQKNRTLGVRRLYNVMPKSAKKYIVDAKGTISNNEA